MQHDPRSPSPSPADGPDARRSPLRRQLMRVAGTDLKRLVTTGVPHLLTAIVLTQGMNMIRQVLLRWLLDPAEIGKIAYVMQIVDLLVILADIGIGTAVLKFAAEPVSDREKSRIYVTGMFWSGVTSCVGALIYLVAVLLLPVHEEQMVRYFMLMLVPYIPIAAVRKLPILFMQARKEIKRAALYTTITQVFTLAILLGATAAFGLWGYFITLILAPTTNLAVLLWATQAHLHWFRPSVRMLRKFATFGFFSVLANGASMANATVTIVLLKWLTAPAPGSEAAAAAKAADVSDALVGLYATAALVRNALRLLPMSLMQTAFPYLSGLLKSPARLRHRTWELTWKQTAVLVPVVLAWALLGPYAIDWVIGPEYADAYWPALILLVGLLPFSLRAPAAQTLIAMNKVHLNAAASAILLVANVPLVLLLVPWFSITGAAAASVIAETSAMVFALVTLRLAFRDGPPPESGAATPGEDDDTTGRALND